MSNAAWTSPSEAGSSSWRRPFRNRRCYPCPTATETLLVSSINALRGVRRTSGWIERTSPPYSMPVDTVDARSAGHSPVEPCRWPRPRWPSKSVPSRTLRRGSGSPRRSSRGSRVRISVSRRHLDLAYRERRLLIPILGNPDPARAESPPRPRPGAQEQGDRRARSTSGSRPSVPT